MNGAQFLELALSSAKLKPSDIQTLRREKIKEDQRLEYKRGKWLNDSRGKPEPGKPLDGAGKLRKWVAGFANAEGGVLVLGMAGHEAQPDLTPFDLEGCAPKNGGIVAWAQTVLRDFPPYLSVPICYHELEVEGHTVFAIAVPRAVRLFDCVECGKHVHYLRNDDETVVMAPGLLTDLLAGRRARPHVVLDVETNAEIDKSISYLDLRATVRNEGLSPVESYVCGIVSHAPFTLGRKPGFSVSRFLNILPTTLPLPGFEPRLDLHSDHTPLAPFDERAHAFRLPVPTTRVVPGTRWWFVVFVVAAGDLPRLKQVDFILKRESLIHDYGIADVLASGRGLVRFETAPSPWIKSAWRARPQDQKAPARPQLQAE